jgi:hypothetical protein
MKTIYRQKQDAIQLLRTTEACLTLPLNTLLPAESVLKAIAYKSRKLGLTQRKEYTELIARITDIEIYKEVNAK